jgi:hypothetical protein
VWRILLSLLVIVSYSIVFILKIIPKSLWWNMIYLFLLIWRVHYETLDQWNILKLGHGLGVGPLSYGDTCYLHNNGQLFTKPAYKWERRTYTIISDFGKKETPLRKSQIFQDDVLTRDKTKKTN